MSKQILKDFKSFLMETESKSEWEHDSDKVGHEEDYTTVHNTGGRGTYRGASLSFVHGGPEEHKGKPYYTVVNSTDNQRNNISTSHRDLKSALAHLKKHGHEIPHEELKTFLSNSLHTASSYVPPEKR